MSLTTTRVPTSYIISFVKRFLYLDLIDPHCLVALPIWILFREKKEKCSFSWRRIRQVSLVLHDCGTGQERVADSCSPNQKNWHLFYLER